MEKIPIRILDYADLSQIEDALNKRRRPASEEGDEIWESYHEALLAVADEVGRAGDDPNDVDLDFYYGGDWFHELSDGFSVLSPNGVSSEVFQKFQAVVAAHHPDACLMLGGDWRAPICGLQIFITASEIYVGWHKMTAMSCRKKLKKLGVELV